MQNRGQIIIGAAVILRGLLLLIGNLLDVDIGALCWPAGLILLGIWFLVRPQLVRPDTALRMRIFGPIRRVGVWQVTEQELWLFVGDVILDLAQAQVPVGETPIRVFAFVGNIRLYAPEDVGVAVSSIAFVTDARMLGQKRERFLAPAELVSDGYEAAERKVRLEAMGFVTDIRVRRA
jgi:predicted membrane protein